MTPIRILLVEHDFEEAIFLKGALEEIQEAPTPAVWAALEVIHVDTLEDAEAVITAGEADVLLLDPDLPGVTAFTAFRTLRAPAPNIPVILLLDYLSEGLASRLLRDGAQDYLIKSEIDCGPLSRAIRNAVERQRYLNAFRQTSTFDGLTGLQNHRGFHAAATRELHLAAGCGQPLLLVLTEIENLGELTAAYGEQQRETCLLDAADILRENAGQTALLGCFEGYRFAALVWNMRPEEFIGRIQDAVAERPRPFALTFGWTVTHPGEVESLDPLLDAAEASLCDNEHAYPIDPKSSRLTQPIASAIV